MLFADINSDNILSSSERILPTTEVSRTIPVNGWQQWEDRYNITASTETTGHNLVLGKKIGSSRMCVFRGHSKPLLN